LSLLAASTRAMAAQRRGSEILADTAAHYSRVRKAIGRGGVFHFAGHAVFDANRPERSYLLLAAHPGEPGRLTAEELEGLRLGSDQLVVLAACETQRAAESSLDGFSGLSAALIAAGAGGVIGSTWRVDESATALLMEAFYSEYSRPDQTAGDALRGAQLRMLRSGVAGSRSPAAWAGFRYAGR
jgi:CHAT domain-containing protein